MGDSGTTLKALLDCISDGVCILDGAGLVVATNDRLAGLLDFPPGFLRQGDPANKLTDHMRRFADIALPPAGGPVKPFRYEARWSGGSFLEIRGDPGPAGKFVLTVADVTERHRLRATQHLLGQALDAIADGFAVFDPNDRLVVMNKLYIGYDPGPGEGSQLGITFEDLMRQDRRHGFYPEVVGHETPFIEDRIAAHREGTGRPVNFRTSDGRWAQARDYRLPDGSTVVVRTDVTELVERDRSLRESQASLAAAQRIAKMGSWEMDLANLDDVETNPLRWSDETFRIFGYEPNEVGVSNEAFYRAVHPDDREKVREAVERALKSGVPYNVEHRVIRPDGYEIAVHDRSDIVSDPDGRPIKMVGTIQDVTEQRAAERRRDEFRALLEATSEASPDGILVTDAEGRYLFWNRRFKKMWDLSDAYLEHRRAVGLGPDADVSPFTDQLVEPRLVLDEIGRVYHRSEQPNTRLADLVLRDGRVFDRHAARVAPGKLPYATVAWLYRDVTDQRKRDASMAETARLTTVGEMAGGMAHELNNLLMVIGGNLELIEAQERRSGAVSTTQYIATTHGAVERGAELIRHLLTFSRRQPLIPRLLDVNAFLADMMDVVARLLGQRVALRFRPGHGLWQTIVDPGFLQTTLVSLATNARDAMPTGGTLVIETANRTIDQAEAEAGAEATAGEYMLMTVTDDGAGMPSDVAKRAFEPFFTTKPVGKGTGLGLSVVYGFVKQSGGHIAIRSAPGQGTTIAIYLPRALSESVAGAEVSVAPASRGNQESILLVEDDPEVRAVARAFLDDLGYRVIEAENGEKALDVLRSAEPIDLLFTDIVLADGLNGAEVARAAGTLRPGLKVLFASGRADEAFIHEGGIEPGGKLLAKPYRKRDLARAIGALL